MAKKKAKQKNADKVASSEPVLNQQSSEKLENEEIQEEKDTPPPKAPSSVREGDESPVAVASKPDIPASSEAEIVEKQEEEAEVPEVVDIEVQEAVPEKDDKKPKAQKKGKKEKKDAVGAAPASEKVKKEKKTKAKKGKGAGGDEGAAKVVSEQSLDEKKEDEAAPRESEERLPDRKFSRRKTKSKSEVAIQEEKDEATEEKVQKDKTKSEASLKKKSKSGLSSEIIEKPSRKKSGADASPESVKKSSKKKKKKKKGDKDAAPTDVSTEASETKVKKKKSKGKTKGKTKGKKRGKSLSAADEEKEEKEEKEETEEKEEIKKKKGKKEKKGKKMQRFSETVIDTERQERRRSSKKGSSFRLSISGRSQSHPSFEEFLKSSSHAMSQERLRKASSIWTLTESTSSGSEESETEMLAQKKMSSVVLIKPKKGKKGRKDKHKKEKKEKIEEEREAGEEKKPKKGKKRKGKVAEAEVPPIEPQEDILAEIAKLKYLTQLETSEEEEETEEGTTPKSRKKKKKGAKKKLSKKEKARLAAEQAEKARANAEEEAAKAAELEKIRLEQEKKAAIEKEKRETIEQKIRMENLEGSAEFFKSLVLYNERLRADAKTKNEWEYYVNCGRLPNPSKCDQMNTFLHLWQNMIEETSMEEAAKKTIDVLELLNELDDLIDTAQEKNSAMVQNWKWVRLLFRRQQSKSLDVATYRLLRNIDKNLNRIDIPTADYEYHDENIALCLWLRIQLPTPLPNPRRPPKPRIEVEFPQMKLEVQFPLSIDGERTAVRALYVKYDHLSDLCDSYDKPPVPEAYNKDLYNAMKLEWREKLLYKYDNRVRKIPQPQEGEETAEPPEEPPIGPDEEVPIVPYRKLEPTASEYAIAREDELYAATTSRLIKNIPDNVINLRKYSIIGGIYSLNLIQQPPQPQDFVTLELNLTPLYLPKELEFVDFYLEYNPPAPAEPGVRRAPEEIEEDMKKQEEELEKLILITLTWPDHVIFLELPMVCYWNSARRFWSKTEVHDLKHNEEKGQLTFRTRVSGTFALAVYRYANLPYQAWEMRPEANGSVSLQITAAILMVEFNVKDGAIALSQLQNSPNNALQDIIGVYFSLPKLIRVLQSAGVDVFPAFDAFCYIENTCQKHWPMEKQLYFNMAQLAVCFNFAWSRWNMTAGRRSVVLQMREYNVEKTKQKNHLMLHVTPLSAIYIDCTEVSQTFNEEGIENMKFYSNLFHLMKGTSSMAFKNKVQNASKELVFALYELLTATRVVSFS